MKNKLHIDFNAELSPGDTVETTYGCRQNNPDICGNNSMKNVCAFVNEDHICRKPSRAWKKQFEVLSKSGMI